MKNPGNSAPAGLAGVNPLETRRARRARGELRRRRRWFITGLAVAAAAVAAVAFWPERAFLPELIARKGSGEVRIAGVDYRLSDPEALADALQPGATLLVKEGAVLDVRYGDAFLLQFDPGTVASLPDPFGGMAGQEARARIEYGEMRLRTGPGFLPASSFNVTTPEGRIHLVGTIVSIFRDSTGTCVCVFEGTASVGTGEADMESIPAGKRKVMPTGGDPFIDDIAPPHRDHLLEFQEKYSAGF